MRQLLAALALPGGIGTHFTYVTSQNLKTERKSVVTSIIVCDVFTS